MVTAVIVGAKPIAQIANGVTDGDYAVITWALTTADPNGAGVTYFDYTERTVQFTGSFGGATAALQGSLDGGTTWFTLDDLSGDPLALDTAGGGGVGPAVPLVRAALTVVGVGAAVNAHLFVKR
jgi:hypothetical protein